MARRRGAEHHMWKGEEASYDALHKRVVATRGRPQECEDCGTTEGNMSWCNLNGNYEDVNDYARLCRSCHQRMDCERRIETKEMTCPKTTGTFKHANRCIMTEEQVLEAKQLRQEGWSWVSLGRRYNVVGNTVKFAVNGRNWKHLRAK